MSINVAFKYYGISKPVNAYDPAHDSVLGDGLAFNSKDRPVKKESDRHMGNKNLYYTKPDFGTDDVICVPDNIRQDTWLDFANADNMPDYAKDGTHQDGLGNPPATNKIFQSPWSQRTSNYFNKRAQPFQNIPDDSHLLEEEPSLYVLKDKNDSAPYSVDLDTWRQRHYRHPKTVFEPFY